MLGKPLIALQNPNASKIFAQHIEETLDILSTVGKSRSTFPGQIIPQIYFLTPDFLPMGISYVGFSERNAMSRFYSEKTGGWDCG